MVMDVFCLCVKLVSSWCRSGVVYFLVTGMFFLTVGLDAPSSGTPGQELWICRARAIDQSKMSRDLIVCCLLSA